MLQFGWIGRCSFQIFVSYLQKDKDSELSFRWKHCSITQAPLQTPIVACGLGRLYSKDAVIEAVLDRANLPETAQHIRNLKVSFRMANLSNSVKETLDQISNQNSHYMFSWLSYWVNRPFSHLCLYLVFSKEGNSRFQLGCVALLWQMWRMMRRRPWKVQHKFKSTKKSISPKSSSVHHADILSWSFVTCLWWVCSHISFLSPGKGKWWYGMFSSFFFTRPDFQENTTSNMGENLYKYSLGIQI